MSGGAFDPPRIGVGGAVIERDAAGELCVLLIQRGNPPRKGSWSIPGGRLEAGESIVAAVARELLEETGLVVRVGALIEVVEVLEAPHHFVVLDYACARISGDVRAGDDAADAAFVRVDDLAAYRVTEAVLRIARRAAALAAAT
ncbi:MAG TPA: NUDIX domain-containing protein [Byssovorax sp.]